MRKKSKTERVQCAYFVWRIRQMPSGIYWADGRSNNINVGRTLTGRPLP